MSEAADRIRVDHDAVANRIRGRRDLTTASKTAALARNHARAETAMRELQQQASADSASASRNAHRGAFGIANGSAADYRAAQAQVAGIRTSREAADLYREADLAGDETLVKAIAARALALQSTPLGQLDRGWAGLLDTFTADYPAVADDIQTLTVARSTTPAELFQYVVPKPSEISSLSTTSLNAALAYEFGGDAA